MHLSIELPDDLATVLQTQTQSISADRYVSSVLERTLASQTQNSDAPHQPFETGYGMWAKYGPAPSAEEIDENRREMFQNFAQD